MSGSYDEASEEITDSFWEVSEGLGSCLSPYSTQDLNLASRLPWAPLKNPQCPPGGEALKAG